jgi:putative intracellular protease/amidase
VQVAIVLYPGVTALDAIGPYEVLRLLPDVDLRFVWHESGHAEMAQLVIEYDPHPPFDSGHPSKASKRVTARAMAMMVRDSTSRPQAAAIPKLLWSSAIRRVRERR